MTKDEILDALEDERERFLDAIDGLSDEELQTAGVVGEWSIKDIMIHLSAWEAELVKLLWQARQGQISVDPDLSDEELEQRNQEWFEAYHTRPLERVMEDFAGVRKQTVRRVESFSDRELENLQGFAGLKGALWKWVAEYSFQHEAEHTRQIKQWTDSRQDARPG